MAGAHLSGQSQEAFPGAAVEVPFQRNTSGSLPCGLRPAVYTPEGWKEDDECQGWVVVRVEK